MSVVTPTFNHEQYIDDCIGSVSNQVYGQWEQIVVDDGSTDSTTDRVAAHNDPRVRLLRKAHGGIGALGTRYNEALQASRGELIAILEGDDCWPSWKLSQQVELFRDENVLLSWGSGLIIDERGTSLGRLDPMRGVQELLYLGVEDLLPKLLGNNFIVPSSGVVVRRTALERVGGFVQPEGIPYVDLPTWLAIVATMHPRERFVYLNEIMVSWRSHSQQYGKHYRDMVNSHARVVTDFLRGLSSFRHDARYPWLEQSSAIGDFSFARAAIANGEWIAAKKYAHSCWSQVGLLARLEVTLWHLTALALSVLIRRDLFEGIFNFQWRLPAAVSKFTSVPTK